MMGNKVTFKINEMGSIDAKCKIVVVQDAVECAKELTLLARQMMIVLPDMSESKANNYIINQISNALLGIDRPEIKEADNE